MDETSPRQSARLPRPLQLYLRLTLLFTALSWLFAYACHLRGLPNPYSWPYYSHDFGSDFSSFQQRFQYFHTAQFFPFKGPVFLYPAPLAVFYHLLFAAWGNRPHVDRVFEAFALSAACVATLLFFRALHRRGIATSPAALFCLVSLVFSYPLYFDIQRGNVEVIVWITLMAAFWAFRRKQLAIAAILIGFAIAFKWYPVVLLGLFLYPRKYKHLPTALVTAVAVTALSNLWLGPTIKTSFLETIKGMQAFVEMYARHYSDLGYDHSFFSIFKFFMHPFKPNLAVDLNRYLALAALSATVLYFLRIRRLPAINQISILLILSITLPPVSYDYTLLHLYICWGIFALYLAQAQRDGLATRPALSRPAMWIMGCYAFALAPHAYIILLHQRYCGQVRWIGLVALLYFFLKYPFDEIPGPLRDALPTSAVHSRPTPTFEGHAA